MQNKVLVVDGDTRSLRLLEVSLKQAGYRVVTATSGLDALSQLEVEVPDLVLADTDIGAVDGFALYARLQQRPEWAHLPFIFILDGDNPTEKLRAVQLGAGEFLTRPVFLKEALSRVELLLEKQAQRGERGPRPTPTSGRARFAGTLSGTAVLDLLQTMELGRKSGIAYCGSGRGQRATVYFADGAVVDAELGRLHGMDALYRILTFAGGEYRVELLNVVRPPRIEMAPAGLLMEAMRYLEEWNRLCAALPPLTAPLTPLGATAGALRPESLPAELRAMLQRFDGRRSVLDVLDLLDEEAAPPHDALARLGAVAKLYAARLLTPAGRPVSGEPRAPVPTPLAVPRLAPPPSARLTPPPMPPLPRLTPPPLPRLTPPPGGGRAAAIAGLGRPTPVSLPRAIVKTPAPLADSGALMLPEDLLITLVPGQPHEESAAVHRTPAASSSDESLTPLPPPFPAAARPTPREQPAVHSAMPQLFPPRPHLSDDSTPPWPPAAAARPTPPPLATHSPAPPQQASSGTRSAPSELARARLTPPPLPVAEGRAARLTPVAPLAPTEAASAPAFAPERMTPPPTPANRTARLTPEVPGATVEAVPPVPAPAAGRMTPPVPAGRPERLTPPPIPAPPIVETPPPISAHSAGRMTPPPIPTYPVERMTPTAVPAHPAGRMTPPPIPTYPIENVTPTAVPAHPAGRMTPPPIPAYPMERMTPPLIPAHPVERMTPPPSPAHAMAGLTPELGEAAAGPLPALGAEPMTPQSREEKRTPVPLEMMEPAASTLPELRLATLTPAAVVAAAAPPAEPSPARPSDAPARGPSESASSPGHNLARLAQRLAATRQPLPFGPPQLPNSAASATALSSEPAAVGRPLPQSEPDAAAVPAGQSWIGSLPELEPISIPEFELTIEHSAPSWIPEAPPPGSSPASPSPSRVLKTNNTPLVQLRSQKGAAEQDQAVHISAPVPLPAPASISLPPIELDESVAPPLRLPVPPPAGRSSRRWGKVVAWIVAGTALFSLGAGLYWVRQELDRGITVSLPQRQEATVPRATPSGTSEPAVSGGAVPPPGAAKPESAHTAATPSATAIPAEVPAAELGSQAVPGPETTAAARAPQHLPAAPVPPQNLPAAAAQRFPAAAAAAPNLPAAAMVSANVPAATATPSVPAAAAGASDTGSSAAAAAPAAPQPQGEFATLLARARAFEHRGALTQAYHAAHSAQRLQPRSAAVFALLAQLAVDEGSADKAAGLAKRALSLDKNNADAYLVLGTVEQARSHGTKARAYFKKYLALAPSGERAVEVRAVLHLSHH